MKRAGRPAGSQDILVWRNGRYVRPRTLPTEERFMCYVDQTGDCWEWIGTKSRTGYGRFSVSGSGVSAHRFSYEMRHGRIPEGLEIDHLCRNRACVNPAHLEPVTHRENVLRSENPIAALALRETCDAGHPLASGEGKRRCFACRPRRLTLDERLRSSYEVEPSGCWRWTAEYANGYPRFFANGRRHQATRFLYESAVGAIPAGAALVSDCDRTCVNPEHYQPVVDARWHPKQAA